MITLARMRTIISVRAGKLSRKRGVPWNPRNPPASASAFTVPTVGLGSCQCIVCPKTCCENRGQIWKVALFSRGAIEHWENNRALSEQWSSAYYGK